jgi:tryptophan synthase alpha subunit
VRRHRHLDARAGRGVLEYADGAIVGTALVRALRDGGSRPSPQRPAP